jgi:hypothetical protein
MPSRYRRSGRSAGRTPRSMAVAVVVVLAAVAGLTGPPGADGSGGVRVAEAAACTSVTLTPGLASPQPAGTTVPFTAQAQGCASAEYQFWVFTTDWAVAQPFSSSATFNWNTSGLPAAFYYIAVWARETGSGVNGPQAQSSLTYRLTASGGCTSVTLTPSLASPRPVGTTITWTAQAGGCGVAEYQFWVNDGAWTVAQPFWTGTNFVWNTTGLAAGTYYVAVWARARTGRTRTAGSRTPLPGP